MLLKRILAILLLITNLIFIFPINVFAPNDFLSRAEGAQIILNVISEEL